MHEPPPSDGCGVRSRGGPQGKIGKSKMGRPQNAAHECKTGSEEKPWSKSGIGMLKDYRTCILGMPINLRHFYWKPAAQSLI